MNTQHNVQERFYFTVYNVYNGVTRHWAPQLYCLIVMLFNTNYALRYYFI